MRANVPSRIFRVIQQNFLVGLVYSLFHPTFHSCESLRMLKLRISNDSTKLKRSAKENHNNTKSYTCTPQIEMTFNSNREILTIYLNYNNMVKNTKMQQKLKIAEKETASRPKKVYKGNRKKINVEETYPLSRFNSA